MPLTAGLDQEIVGPFGHVPARYLGHEAKGTDRGQDRRVEMGHEARGTDHDRVHPGTSHEADATGEIRGHDPLQFVIRGALSRTDHGETTTSRSCPRRKIVQPGRCHAALPRRQARTSRPTLQQTR